MKNYSFRKLINVMWLFFLQWYEKGMEKTIFLVYLKATILFQIPHKAHPSDVSVWRWVHLHPRGIHGPAVPRVPGGVLPLHRASSAGAPRGRQRGRGQGAGHADGQTESLVSPLTAWYF